MEVLPIIMNLFTNILFIISWIIIFILFIVPVAILILLVGVIYLPLFAAIEYFQKKADNYAKCGSPWHSFINAFSKKSRMAHKRDMLICRAKYASSYVLASIQNIFELQRDIARINNAIATIPAEDILIKMNIQSEVDVLRMAKVDTEITLDKARYLLGGRVMKARKAFMAYDGGEYDLKIAEIGWGELFTTLEAEDNRKPDYDI